MTMTRFRLLGPLEFGIPPREITGGQQRSLLAMLLLNAGRVVSYQELIDEAWPEERAAKLRPNTVNAQMARLREQLNVAEDIPLLFRSGGYQLGIDPGEVDVAEFRRLRLQGATLAGRSPKRAIVVLRQALELWRGPALQDSALGRRCQAAAAGLEQAKVQAFEHLAAAHLAAGSADEVVDELHELAVLHPMREPLLRVLMTALAESGRRPEALVVYRAARARLDAELGIEPGEALQVEHRRILQGTPS